MPVTHVAEGRFLELKKNVVPEFTKKNSDTCDTYNDNDDDD
jgi:hypothetical protein